MNKKNKKNKNNEGFSFGGPMKCAVCVECIELVYNGIPQGMCIYGGPFGGYVNCDCCTHSK